MSLRTPATTMSALDLELAELERRLADAAALDRQRFAGKLRGLVESGLCTAAQAADAFAIIAATHDERITRFMRRERSRIANELIEGVARKHVE